MYNLDLINTTDLDNQFINLANHVLNYEKQLFNISNTFTFNISDTFTFDYKYVKSYMVAFLILTACLPCFLYCVLSKFINTLSCMTWRILTCNECNMCINRKKLYITEITKTKDYKNENENDNDNDNDNEKKENLITI